MPGVWYMEWRNLLFIPYNIDYVVLIVHCEMEYNEKNTNLDIISEYCKQ